MLTIIAYHPTGYEVRIEVESEKLDPTIRWLEKNNYRPVRNMSDKQALDTAEAKPAHPTPAVGSNPGNGRGTKAGNGPGTVRVAAINDDLFGDK
jgi:hypothetical protein